MHPVGEFIGAALRAGDAGVVIATEAHRKGVEARLAMLGLGARVKMLDARDTLSRFVVDGRAERRDGEHADDLVDGDSRAARQRDR